MTWCIYKIENKINGKCYIGQSEHIKTRFRDHKRNGKLVKSGDKTIKDSLAKYGVKNFTFQIIEEVETQEDANDRETYWVSHYDSLNNGYNCTKGGMNAPKTEEWIRKVKETRMKNGGYGHSEKTKKLISDTWHQYHTPEVIEKVAEGNRGKKLSEEQKQRLSDFHKGNQYCLGHKQPQEVIEKRKTTIAAQYETKVCAVEGCDRTDGFKYKGVRYCDMHVERLKKHGTTDKRPHPKPTLGKKMSEETKQKISKNRKGKAKGEANGFYGKKHSLEMINYLRDINLGKEPPNKIKLSDDVILKIRNDSRSLRKIGADYGVSTTVIRRIKRSE